MKAVLDACVLYPTVLREILIGCARAGLYTPLWSARILEEWARATVKQGPGAEAVARGEVAALRAAGADAIVTFNAQDFPRHVLAAEGLDRRDPDGFLWELWSRDPATVGAVLDSVRGEAERLSGQPQPMRALLKRAKLPRLAKAIDLAGR
jgi:hypothetical protein